jgi:arginase family enzyme
MKNGNGWLEKLRFDGPVYLSIDMDCLDPAFGPGVSHHEPGGMTTREVIDIIHHFKGRLIGADIVETNPERDVNSMTAMVAAKFLKEVIARIHQDTLKTE